MSTHIQKSTRSEGGSWHRTLPIAVVAAIWLISASSAGAVDIQSINLGTLNDGADTRANKVRYRGQSRSITSFTDANGSNWDLTGGSTPRLTLRRSGAAPTDASGTVKNRQVVWGRREGTRTNPYIVLPSQPTTTQNALNQNNIFLGTDNLFTNTGNNDNNQSDVERADFIINGGVTAASDLGVTVFERGANAEHDGFKIAPITALDRTGAPSQYGKLVTQNANSWGKNSLTGNQDYVVLRKDGTNTSTNLSFSALVQNQDIGGMVISLTDLGVTAGTTIYGYSIFAADVPNNANLVDWNSFPTTSVDNNGGLDLVAANLGVVRRRAVPFGFSPSLGLLILGATWGAQSLWQRDRIKPVK